MFARLTGMIALSMLGMAWLSAARAQSISYDPAGYQSMVSGLSADTIPVGTHITVHNWQQYKRFMPPGMQALFSGRYMWRFPDDPNFTITIGATRNISMPSYMCAASEKYKGQTKLRKLPEGGYTVEGYTAGLPFADLDEKDPEAGAKLLYDNHYYYSYEFLRRFVSYTFLIDRYLNISAQTGDIAYWRLRHLSDPGYPLNLPYSDGYMTSGRFSVVAPEQSKYTTEIQLLPDDPVRLPEVYVFLPSLRRSLRLTASARCAPALGTDYVGDDSSGNIASPGLFIPVYLGAHKTIGMVHADPAKIDQPQFFSIRGAVPGWPKPEVGNFEVRTVRVLALLPTPSLGRGYCYGAKILMIDSETWIPFWFDIYDSSRRLYKVEWDFGTPRPIQTGENAYTFQGNGVIMDLQNGHATATVNTGAWYDRVAPQDLQNAQVMAFPGSLVQVMK